LDWQIFACLIIWSLIGFVNLVQSIFSSNLLVIISAILTTIGVFILVPAFTHEIEKKKCEKNEKRKR